ncbi:hypothetical protein ABK040_015193 [Willaertia magna]
MNNSHQQGSSSFEFGGNVNQYCNNNCYLQSESELAHFVHDYLHYNNFYNSTTTGNEHQQQMATSNINNQDDNNNHNICNHSPEIFGQQQYWNNNNSQHYNDYYFAQEQVNNSNDSSHPVVMPNHYYTTGLASHYNDFHNISNHHSVNYQNVNSVVCNNDNNNQQLYNAGMVVNHPATNQPFNGLNVQNFPQTMSYNNNSNNDQSLALLLLYSLVNKLSAANSPSVQPQPPSMPQEQQFPTEFCQTVVPQKAVSVPVFQTPPTPVKTNEIDVKQKKSSKPRTKRKRSLSNGSESVNSFTGESPAFIIHSNPSAGITKQTKGKGKKTVRIHHNYYNELVFKKNNPNQRYYKFFE